MNYNKIMLAGNLTRDPELRTTPNGSAVCNFTIASNEKWSKSDGGQGERTTFLDCEAWGKTGEAIARYCAKGKPLFVEGALSIDEWTDKDGNKRRTPKVRVHSFQFVGSRGEARGMEAASEPAPAPAGGSLSQDDIPF